MRFDFEGFDDIGCKFDSVGNLRNWWANETKKSFREKAQCLIDQYDGFTEPLTNLKLSGIATQNENIADNGEFSIPSVEQTV